MCKSICLSALGTETVKSPQHQVTATTFSQKSTRHQQSIKIVSWKHTFFLPWIIPVSVVSCTQQFLTLRTIYWNCHNQVLRIDLISKMLNTVKRKPPIQTSLLNATSTAASNKWLSMCKPSNFSENCLHKPRISLLFVYCRCYALISLNSKGNESNKRARAITYDNCLHAFVGALQKHGSEVVGPPADVDTWPQPIQHQDTLKLCTGTTRHKLMSMTTGDSLPLQL